MEKTSWKQNVFVTFYCSQPFAWGWWESHSYFFPVNYRTHLCIAYSPQWLWKLILKKRGEWASEWVWGQWKQCGVLKNSKRLLLGLEMGIGHVIGDVSFLKLWGNTHNVYHCNHCPSIVGRHHGSPVYSCHLLSIHAASLRSISFLYFTEPIFAWHVPLVSLIFLKRCLVFPSSELNWTEHHGSCVTLLWVVLRCQCLESWWLQPLWASKPKDKTVTGGPPQNSATKGTFHEQLSCLTVSSLVSKFHAGVRISTYLSSDNEERISVARSTSGCEDQMCFNLR